MATITAETLQHIAALARLGLSPAQCAHYAEECAHILAFVEQLNGVDTTGITPMDHADHLETVWREDRLAPSTQADAILEGAPEREHRFFIVPQVIA
ncbi:MAG: Asp-tRNA(Asn)/Glu-tRNA(Gln) amidotransferase subunit GatC [Deltaproteobacteria bacterium]|nr:Asp-tRNA(Asn)/Glu-tRNA(Gln) amidotransferase subunit GatC [Deltaproteobacteria bacterium]